MIIKYNNKLFSKLTFSEGRNPYHGVNRILTQCHILYEPYLGIGIYETRIISCDFIYFRNAMYLTWDTYLVPKEQTRYS